MKIRTMDCEYEGTLEKKTDVYVVIQTKENKVIVPWARIIEITTL